MEIYTVYTSGSLTLDKDGGQVIGDVAGDPQSVPGVDGAVGEDDPGGVDAVASVVLVGLRHGVSESLGTHAVVVATLFHMVPDMDV